MFHGTSGRRHAGQIRLDITNFGTLLNSKWGAGSRLVNTQILTAPSADATGALTYNLQTLSGSLITTPLQTLVIDTEGSAVDTVLSLMSSTCTEPSIACDDDGGLGVGDSLITRTNVLPGALKIAVDAKSALLDTFTLIASADDIFTTLSMIA